MTDKTVISLAGDDLTGRKCVMCKHPATKKFKPFCSKRCADLDLGKWLNGAYIVSDDSPQDENDFSSNQVPEMDQLDQ